MTDNLPELRNGRFPMGEARKRPGIAGQNNCGVDWKTTRLIQTLVVGVDAEIGDNVCGKIPAGVPLDLRQAARAVIWK